MVWYCVNLDSALKHPYRPHHYIDRIHNFCYLNYWRRLNKMLIPIIIIIYVIRIIIMQRNSEPNTFRALRLEHLILNSQEE